MLKSKELQYRSRRRESALNFIGFNERGLRSLAAQVIWISARQRREDWQPDE
jgi:hypothetical protein